MMTREQMERNEEYSRELNREKYRRRVAGLVVKSTHWNRDHHAAQSEFLRWHKETFGSWARMEHPMWDSGHIQEGNPLTHTWFLATPEQVMVAKLAWGGQ